MGVFRLSRRADQDLDDIGDYTLHTWSAAQTERYLRQLENCCRLLANNPALGRSCEHVRPGLRRMEQGKHVVFYRQEPGGILISRILHQSMLPENHGVDDEDNVP